LSLSDDIRRSIHDFEFFCRRFLKVVDKSGEVRPLVFNRAQRPIWKVIKRQLDENKPVRVIIGKCRQAGVSSFCQAFLFWNFLTRPNVSCLCIAHDRESVENLFGMTKFFYENLEIQPKRKYSSRKELVLAPPLNSRIVVKPAGNPRAGRSYTAQIIHASEVAFWDYPELFSAILPSVSYAPGTAIIMESTANGVNNEWYDYWRAAVEGRSVFEPIFVPWFWVEDYCLNRPTEIRRWLDTPLDEYEKWLKTEFGVTEGQLAWRRMKISEMLSQGKSEVVFKAEFPATWEEAFEVAGAPVFDPASLRACWFPTEPLWRGEVVQGPKGPVVEQGATGRLVVYEEPLEGYTRYCVGADPALGTEAGDFSAAVVVRWDSEQKKYVECAYWHGKVDPVAFATVLEGIARYYNNALVAPEVGNIGLLTLVELQRRYYRIYRWRILDTHAAKPTSKRGWWTTRTTKPLFVGFNQSLFYDGSAIIRSRALYEELEKYSYAGSVDEFSAPPGFHDDLVVAWCLATYCHSLEFTEYALSKRGSQFSVPVESKQEVQPVGVTYGEEDVF
jgi:hypothetical protein